MTSACLDSIKPSDQFKSLDLDPSNNSGRLSDMLLAHGMLCTKKKFQKLISVRIEGALTDHATK